MTVLVSVIIPTYNRAHLFEKSLWSILSQSYEHIEVIVVNDGSSDYTLEVGKMLRKKDRRIKIILNKRHLGLPKSRNIGLQHAHGKLVFFSEDDLILSRNTIKILVDTYLKLSPKLKIGAISPRLVLTSRSKSYVQIPEFRYVVGLSNALTGEFCRNYDILSDRVLLAQHIPATSLIPKCVFNDIGIYYTGYKFNYIREESDLYLRMIKKGYNLLYQPEAVAFHATGFHGGCTVENILMRNLANMHNHLVYLIRGYGMKALPMAMVYALKKILKVRYLNNPQKALENLTILENTGYRKALNEYRETLRTVCQLCELSNA